MTRWKKRRGRTILQTQGDGGVTPTTFTETFETGAFQASWDAPVISGTGTITVVTSGALAGTYSGKVTKPLNDSTCYRRKTFTATDSVRASGTYKWLSDSGNSSTNGTGPRIFAGANRIFDTYRVDSTGQLWLRYQSTGLTGAGALFINTGQTAALNTSTKLDMQCDYAAGANSRIRVWVNDVLRIDSSGLTVFAGGYTAFQIGSEHTAQLVDLLVDDIAIDWAPAAPAVTNNTVYSADRKLKLVADNTIFSARGGNVHTNGFSWSQADFDSMAASPTNWNAQRLLVNWKLIETSAGVFDTTQINHVKTSIARASTAGIKTIVCLGITSPVWSDRTNKLPTWSYTSTGPTTPVAPWDGDSLFDVYMSHGEAYTRKMIQELGPDDNVIGFDPWNEPDHQPASEVQSGMQRFLGWARSEPAGADKLWLVTNPYSSQSAAAGFNDWAAITDWTNVVLQVHSYFAPASATDDGWRTDNGMRDGGATFWNGGPEATSYNTANKAAMRLHFAPWNTISQTYGVPWILGEFGVQYNKTTATERDNWARDMVEAAELEGCAGVFWWIYATNSGSDPWSARPGGTWRPEAQRTGTFDA